MVPGGTGSWLSGIIQSLLVIHVTCPHNVGCVLSHTAIHSADDWNLTTKRKFFRRPEGSHMTKLSETIIATSGVKLENSSNQDLIKNEIQLLSWLIGGAMRDFRSLKIFHWILQMFLSYTNCSSLPPCYIQSWILIVSPYPT